MKQIPRPNAAVWRSIAICTVAGLIIVVDNQYAPTEPVQADSYDYSKVDRLCFPGIDRTASIPQEIAAQIEALPAFTPIQTVVALAGPRVYCQLPPKSASTPNGAMWGDPYILPINGTFDVLVVIVDALGQVIDVQRWNAAPDDRQRIQQQVSDHAAYWIQPANQQPEPSMLPYHRRNPAAQPVQPQQETCR